MRVIRVINIIVLLFLLTSGTPLITLAQEERAITLEPTKVMIGESVTISGQGFNKSTSSVDKHAAIFFSHESATTSDDIDEEVNTYQFVVEGLWLDEEGAFETTFIVPSMMTDGTYDQEVTAGTYYVYVCHYIGSVVSPRIRAASTLTVTRGEITLQSDRGVTGTMVAITGNYFDRDLYLSIEYDGQEVTTEKGDNKANDNGEFTAYITIPESTAGRHTVSVYVADYEVETGFLIETDVIFEKTSGEADNLVMVEGSGFGRSKDVTIDFDDVGISTARTDTSGSFSTRFNVPGLDTGIYNVVISDEDDNTYAARFTVFVPPSTPSPSPVPPSPVPVAITSSPAGGSVGTNITISGSGFEAGSEVVINYDDMEVATAGIAANGAFIAIFTVPLSTYGQHIIIASDTNDTAKAVFTMESDAPPVPLPLSPPSGTRLHPPVALDWQDVSDDSSPITYNIQIATGSDFAPDAIVLEEKGLTASYLLITESEGAMLTAQQESYYWRVRAIDGAANEGDWSQGSQLTLTVPATGFDGITYIAIGVVVLLLFIIFGSWSVRKKKGKTRS